MGRRFFHISQLAFARDGSKANWLYICWFNVFSKINGKEKGEMLSKLESIMLIAALLTSVAPIAFAGPTQPPVDTTTLYNATIGWGPRRADPARAYDTVSGELISNVYDNLITFGEPVSNAFKSNWEVEEQYWAFQPELAINVPDKQIVDCSSRSDSHQSRGSSGAGTNHYSSERHDIRNRGMVGRSTL